MAYIEIEETEKLCSEDENLCSDAPNTLEDNDHTMEMFLCSDAPDTLEDEDHTLEMFFMAPDFIEERLDKELCGYYEGPEIPADAETEPMMEMTDNHTMEMLLMTHVEKALDETTWFLDSGCSNHMCWHKEFFSEMDESFRKFVKLGNNSSIDVVGKGKVHLQINQLSQIITEVFYIPELKNNILNIGQLQEKGLGIVFRNNTCRVYHPERGLILETRMSLNRMFILLAKIQTQNQQCFLTPTPDLNHLWHCHYGHLSFGGLKTLQQKQMVHGLPQLQYSNLLCEDCSIGKTT